MSQEDKENILIHIYYNEDGFGSINETYKEAKKQLNTIAIEDTKTWLEKQKGRQTKAYKGFNSYVADEPLEEMPIDLADFTRSAAENDGYRYCLVAVDVFTEMLWGVPIKNKKPEDATEKKNNEIVLKTLNEVSKSLNNTKALQTKETEISSSIDELTSKIIESCIMNGFA